MDPTQMTDEQRAELKQQASEGFDGESISHHTAGPDANVATTPQPTAAQIVQFLKQIKARENDRKNRKAAKDNRQEKSRKAAKAAKAARKKRR